VHDEIIGISDQHRRALHGVVIRAIAGPGGRLHPVQGDVQKQGACHPALRSSLLGAGQPAVLDHARLQPSADHSLSGERADLAEDVIVADPVKRPGQVRVEHPQAPGILLGDLKDRFDRVVAATAGPKPIGLRLKPRLPLGLQRIHDPRLVHTVENHRDPERAPLAARLRDEHPSDRQGLEPVRRVVHP
jgi:hypothetical protein